MAKAEDPKNQRICFNWDSFHAKLNSHYKVWSQKKKNKNHIGKLFRENLKKKHVFDCGRKVI